MQLVLRPRIADHPDYRGLADRVSSGVLELGDDIVALPSGGRTTVTSIDTRWSSTAGHRRAVDHR